MRRLRDAWVPILLTVFLLVEIAFFWVPSEAGSRGAALAFGLPMCAALLWRWRASFATAVVIAGLVVAWSAVGPPAGTLGPWLVTLVAIYCVAQEREPWRALLGGALVIAATNLMVGLAPTVGFGDYAFITVFGVLAWAAGRAMLTRHRRGEQLAELAAREAVADERLRIARELHDVVAHNVGVIVVQAQAAGGLMDDAPDDATRAVRSIETTGRQALTEMRRLVGLMRSEPNAPLPGLGQLDALAHDLRGAGMAITVAVVGEPVALPPSVDASGYRIVQEGLTNVLKHAPGAHAEVLVAYTAGAVELTVTDDGPGGARGNGHGLVGIRERVAVFGGELDAGPQPDGGWRVRARLPLV